MIKERGCSRPGDPANPGISPTGISICGEYFSRAWRTPSGGAWSAQQMLGHHHALDVGGSLTQSLDAKR